MASAETDVSGLSSDVLAQLNNAESKTLLDTVDNLRELQVGEIINLPQIIVVGDQSSGKSSVLEAISRVRFPVDEDVCTRFATELVLRRAKEAKVDVSIQYASRPPASGQAHNTPEPFRKSGFDKDALPDLIKEAKERMGIQKRSFSKDILRVEIAGPDVHPLTLVDLPGFFHSGTADQSEESKEIVDQLVESYMKQEKSIILAVVAANYNLANQAVLKQAKKHDPTRQRTLGVITKPDLAGTGPNVRRYIDLAKGFEAEHKLTLGWFVLRNRSHEEKDLSFDERDANEERFFQSGAWSSIRQTNRGVENLRRRLSNVLLSHIKTNLPSVIREIDDNLCQRNEELQRLGTQRATGEEIRLYLLGIAEKFQRLARDGVEGRYSDNFFGDLNQDARKLRALLRKLNRAFSVTLSTKGMTYKIGQGNDEEDNPDDDEEDDYPEYLDPFIDHYRGFLDPEFISQSDLNSKVELLAANNQGKEFPGTPNSDLALQFFKMQAKPWKDISKFHLALTLEYSKAFVELAFSHIIGTDVATVGAVLRDHVDPFFDKMRATLDTKLEELLRPYTDGYGLPIETQFHQTLSRATLQRLVGQVCESLQEEYPEAFEDKPKKGLSRQRILQAISNTDDFQNSEFGTEKVIDMMVAYYEMSRRTLTENVINLAVESCLVCNIPDILTPGKVYTMTEDELKRLAAESEDVQVERAILKDQIEVLKRGLEVCRSSRPREVMVGPLVTVSSSGGHSRSASRSPAPGASATANSSVLANGARRAALSAPDTPRTSISPAAAPLLSTTSAASTPLPSTQSSSSKTYIWRTGASPAPVSGSQASRLNAQAGLSSSPSAGTSSNTANTNSGSLFSTGSGSGASAPSTFGSSSSSSLFGGISTNQTTNSSNTPSLFQTTPAKPAFGSSSSSIFGGISSTQTTSPSNAPSLFQTTSAKPTFGSGSGFAGLSSSSNSGFSAFGTSSSSKPS